MRLFHYFTKREWIDPWVNGGRIPLFHASKYYSLERREVFTPDESIDRKLIGLSGSDLELLVSVGPQATLHMDVGTVTIDRDIKGKNVQYHQSPFDGVVLCFSTKLSTDIARRMNKEACVEILQFDLLKYELDKQLGLIGEARACEYTTSYDRGVFLKSIHDEYQQEFRIFWKDLPESEVQIPAGVASVVDFNGTV